MTWFDIIKDKAKRLQEERCRIENVSFTLPENGKVKKIGEKCIFGRSNIVQLSLSNGAHCANVNSFLLRSLRSDVSSFWWLDELKYDETEDYEYPSQHKDQAKTNRLQPLLQP